MMLFSPSTHFVSFVRAVLCGGAGFHLVWGDRAAIAALGFLFGAALMRFRRMVVQIRA
jgi:ABC-2 type transport system permease protein